MINPMQLSAVRSFDGGLGAKERETLQTKVKQAGHHARNKMPSRNLFELSLSGSFNWSLGIN